MVKCAHCCVNYRTERYGQNSVQVVTDSLIHFRFEGACFLVNRETGISLSVNE